MAASRAEEVSRGLAGFPGHRRPQGRYYGAAYRAGRASGPRSELSTYAWRRAVPRRSPVALPDFLVIGAPKAGTTALHTALAALPGLDRNYRLMHGGEPCRGGLPWPCRISWSSAPPRQVLRRCIPRWPRIRA